MTVEPSSMGDREGFQNAAGGYSRISQNRTCLFYVSGVSLCFRRCGKGTKPVSGSPLCLFTAEFHVPFTISMACKEELLRRMLRRQRRMRQSKRGFSAAVERRKCERRGGCPWYKMVRIGEASNPGPAGSKVRGKRPEFKDIVILNSSGQPQLLAALQFYKERREGVAVEVIVNQEHHSVESSWNDLRLKAEGLHWHLQGAPAVVADGGSNAIAGVCVATRR